MRHSWILGLAAALAISPGSACAITVDDVIELLQNGVGEQVITDQMRADSSEFDLSTQDIIDLTKAGASDDLIREMIRRQDGGTAGDADQAQPDYVPPVSLGFCYDPFGYYWRSWPGSFSYYYPFRWWDSGFYYAGWWSQSWWGAGPWTRYYRGRYGVPAHRDGGGRYAWSRNARGRTVSWLPATRRIRTEGFPFSGRAAVRRGRTMGYGQAPSRETSHSRPAFGRDPYRNRGAELRGGRPSIQRAPSLPLRTPTAPRSRPGSQPSGSGWRR
jgi:hypothetical protein